MSFLNQTHDIFNLPSLGLALARLWTALPVGNLPTGQLLFVIHMKDSDFCSLLVYPYDHHINKFECLLVGSELTWLCNHPLEKYIEGRFNRLHITHFRRFCSARINALNFKGTCIKYLFLNIFSWGLHM